MATTATKKTPVSKVVKAKAYSIDNSSQGVSDPTLTAALNAQSKANMAGVTPMAAPAALTGQQLSAINSGQASQTQAANNAAEMANGSPVTNYGGGSVGSALAMAAPDTSQAEYAQNAAAAIAAGTAKPTFSLTGDRNWGGASGLSQEAVDWLSSGADSSYLDDVNAAQRTYDGLSADLKTQREEGSRNRMAALGRLGYTYDATAKKGYWNDDDLTSSRGQAMNDMGYDFGARGLLHSSEYARQLANTQQQFQSQADAITTAGDQFNGSLDTQATNANSELADTKLAAIRNAVQRRAATVGALA